MRVRGLKRYRLDIEQGMTMSHPMRVRGLKLAAFVEKTLNSESHPMRVRGLKPDETAAGGFTDVAPHAGAWIETPHAYDDLLKFTSHPMRVRGLKRSSG